MHGAFEKYRRSPSSLGSSKAVSMLVLILSVFVLPTPSSLLAETSRRLPQTITSLTVDPQKPDTLYAGTRAWGLAQSTDGGRTWSQFLFPKAHITALAISLDGQFLFAGTSSRGLIRVRLAGTGRTTSLARGLPDPEIRALAYHPIEPGVLVVGTAAGLALSRDDGETWVQGAGPLDIHDLAISAFQRSPSDDTGVSAFQTNVDRPLDIAEALPTLFVTDFRGVWGCELALDPNASSNPSGCRLLLDNETKDHHRLRSAAQLSGEMDPRSRNILALAPSEPDVIYVGTPAGLFRSVDRGRSWYVFFSLNEVQSLIVHPQKHNVLWAVDTNGLRLSVDAGQSFQTLPHTELLRLTVLHANPRDSDGFIGGTLDGRIATREAGQTRVHALHAGQMRNAVEAPAADPYLHRLPARPENDPLLGPNINQSVDALVADPRFPEILYAGTRYGIFRSTNAGRNWSPRSAGLGDVDVLDLILEPADSYSRNPREEALLLAATNGSGLMRSVDSGRSWHPVSGLDDPVVQTLAFDFADPSTVYAGTRHTGIYRSQDSGLNWTAATDQPEIITILDLAVTPLSIYAATPFGFVFESRDQGTTWQRLGAFQSRAQPTRQVGFTTRHRGVRKLTDFGIVADQLHVHSLLADPDDEGVLIAATSLGIFQTDDHGKTWNRSLAWHNVTALNRHTTQSDFILAATAQGALLSGDRGSTWFELPIDTPITSTTFDLIFPSRIYLGNDQGVVTTLELPLDREPNRRIPKDEITVSTRELARPKLVPAVDSGPVDLSDKPRPQATEDTPHWIRRRQALAFSHKQVNLRRPSPIEDPRVLILLSLESYLRYEDQVTENLTLKRASSRQLHMLKRLQEDYARYGGAQAVFLNPGSQGFAAEYFWDDGLKTHSQIRLFDLNNRYFTRPDVTHLSGPTSWWKEIHDAKRRPTVLRPRSVLKESGPFLGWSPDGRLLLTRTGADKVALWNAKSGNLRREVDGFLSPVRQASLSPDGTILAALGIDGAPLWVDLKTKTFHLSADGEPAADQVLAADDGIWIADTSGTLRFRPTLNQDGAVDDVKDIVVAQMNTRFVQAALSPHGRWWLLGGLVPDTRTDDGLWTHTWLVDLAAPAPSVIPVAAEGLWRNARFDPENELLVLQDIDHDGVLVDLRPTKQGQSPSLHELGSTRTLIFDPIYPLISTSKRLWNVTDAVRTANNSPKRLATGRVLSSNIDGTSERTLPRYFDFQGSFERRRAPTWRPPALLPFSPEPIRLYESSGRWAAEIDDRGLMATELFKDGPSRWMDADLKTIYRPVETQGHALESLLRHNAGGSHTDGAYAVPTAQWPLGIEASAPWKSGSFDDLLTWGCTIAGRNFTRREWSYYFGEEPYQRTCLFEEATASTVNSANAAQMKTKAKPRTLSKGSP